MPFAMHRTTLTKVGVIVNEGAARDNYNLFASRTNNLIDSIRIKLLVVLNVFSLTLHRHWTEQSKEAATIKVVYNCTILDNE